MSSRQWEETDEVSIRNRMVAVYWKRLWHPAESEERVVVVLGLDDGTYWVSANSGAVPQSEDRGPFTKEDAFVAANTMLDLDAVPKHWG